VEVEVLVELIELVPVEDIRGVLLCFADPVIEADELDVLETVILLLAEPLDVDVRVPLGLKLAVPEELADLEELIEDVLVFVDVLVLVVVEEPVDVLDT
jgi:hypothetical protein